MKARKKPVVIDALRLHRDNVPEVLDFIGDAAQGLTQTFDDGIMIQTLEGVHHASFGDVIIRGVKGECYPCKPDIFDATYEVIE